MNEEKEHQSNKTEIQIRIDGKPVYFPAYLCKITLNKYAELCKENPDCYIDIVRVDTQILFSQFEYNMMKKHFNELNT